MIIAVPIVPAGFSILFVMTLVIYIKFHNEHRKLVGHEH